MGLRASSDVSRSRAQGVLESYPSPKPPTSRKHTGSVGGQGSHVSSVETQPVSSSGPASAHSRWPYKWPTSAFILCRCSARPSNTLSYFVPAEVPLLLSSLERADSGWLFQTDLGPGV